LRAARDADPRSRLEAVERRLNLERRTLEAHKRLIRCELRRLRYVPSPTFAGPRSRGKGAQSLFGGSDL
jgi:hypothetical protein